MISNLNPTAKILDIGCGSNSPYLAKFLLPDHHYTGIDIEFYKHTKSHLADVYITSLPEEFVADIQWLDVLFDAIISSHNLDHCNQRERTLSAILDKTKLKGKIFNCALKKIVSAFNPVKKR